MCAQPVMPNCSEINLQLFHLFVLKSILPRSFGFKLDSVSSQPKVNLLPPKHCLTLYLLRDRLFVPMSPEAIISLTAAISIGFRYLEPIHPNMETAQNLQEQRLLDFDKIVTACKWILQQVGRPSYVDSIWKLWAQLSESMFTLERTLWPTQPPETALHIQLPPQPRPLSDVLLDNFDEYAVYVFAAIEPLERFHQWFVQVYDIVLHAEFNNMLQDSILLFRTLESMLRMKQRLQSLLPPPAAAPTPAAATTAAPSAASTAPITTETEARDAAGEVLAWY